MSNATHDLFESDLEVKGDCFIVIGEVRYYGDGGGQGLVKWPYSFGPNAYSRVMSHN